MRRGFTNDCKRFIGLDDPFLKNPFHGILLTIVVLDGNNRIFSIVVARVENENRQSWVWFLSHLKATLNIDDESYWSFMSNRQKGNLISLMHFI